jgi:hypothetical protein
MSFKSRDLTVKLSGAGEGNCEGCTHTKPDCGGCTHTKPDCGQCSPTDRVDCTDTKCDTSTCRPTDPSQSAADLAMLRQQLQETLGAELR